MQLDVSRWKAERWLRAGHALDRLPATADALERGDLGIDKVVELARFADDADDDALVAWARQVPAGAIRRAAELRSKERASGAASDDEDRWLEWRYVDDGRRFQLDAHLPSAQGAVVARALDRLADQVPLMPGEESHQAIGARPADALLALCSARLADDPDQDRATIVVHADLETLHDAGRNAMLEGGPAIPGTTVQRLLCNARVQTVVEHSDGSIAALGRTSREPSAWMMRQLRHRDETCRFPGCDSRRFTQAITSSGGPAAGEPISTTCCSSARSITSSCTSTSGRSDETTATSCGSARAACATARVPTAGRRRPARSLRSSVSRRGAGRSRPSRAPAACCRGSGPRPSRRSSSRARRCSRS
jgi:Domain of unknown function (DUF222)